MVTNNVRLVRQIAEGGMGSIWLADHLGLSAQVAVKFIDSDLRAHPQSAMRFKREASLSARLRSVHVVRTFDHGLTADGTPYIVMELLEGCSLEEWLEVCGTMSLGQVALVMKQAAKALHGAHQLGVVHRDIKPQNIFLCDTDYELFVKVLDFGIAKQAWHPSGDPEMTQTGMVVGTQGYMSPEQAICSKTIDHRADCWSLAAVAYRMVTGWEPYADDAAELPFSRMMRCDLTRPSAFDPTLSPDIDAWFQRALHGDPDMRFDDTIELARSFARLVGRCSVLADDSLDESLDQAPCSKVLPYVPSDDTPVVEIAPESHPEPLIADTHDTASPMVDVPAVQRFRAVGAAIAATASLYLALGCLVALW